MNPDLFGLIPDPTEEIPPPPEEEEIPPPPDDLPDLPPDLSSGYAPDLLQPDIKIGRHWEPHQQAAFHAALGPLGLDYATICAWARACRVPRPSWATPAERAEYLASYEAIHVWERQWIGDIRRDVSALFVEIDGIEQRRHDADVALPPGYRGVDKVFSMARRGLPPAEAGDLYGLSIGRLCDLGRELWGMREALREHVPAPAAASGSQIAAEVAALSDDPFASLEVEDE